MNNLRKKRQNWNKKHVEIYDPRQKSVNTLVFGLHTFLPKKMLIFPQMLYKTLSHAYFLAPCEKWWALTHI